MSLYLCNVNNKEYAVKIIEGTMDGDSVTIEFISRTEGGKGRLPKSRKINPKELTPLIKATYS